MTTNGIPVPDAIAEEFGEAIASRVSIVQIGGATEADEEMWDAAESVHEDVEAVELPDVEEVAADIEAEVALATIEPEPPKKLGATAKFSQLKAAVAVLAKLAIDCIFFQGDEDGELIAHAGFDREIKGAFSVRVGEAKTTSEGIARADARTFSKLAKAFRPDEIAGLFSSGTGLRVQCKGSRVRVPAWRESGGYKLSEPAPFGLGSRTERFTVPTRELAEVLTAIRPFIEKESLHYRLTFGLLTVLDSGDFRGAATNGHRLAEARRWDATDLNIDGSKLEMQIDRETVAFVIAATAAYPSETVKFATDGTHVGIAADNGSWSTTVRLGTGTFPPYERVMPRRDDLGIRFVPEAAAMTAALKRCMMFADSRSEAVTIRADEDEGLRIESGNSDDSGEAVERVKVSSYQGDPIEFGINGRYALEYLALHPEGVQWLCRDPQSALILEPLGSHFDQDTYVLMPIRI